MGNRLKAVRNGVTTKYVYDLAGNLLAEADSSGNITQYYFYGAGLIALKPQGDGVYCYHFDATGNTVALTDQSGNIANTYAYKPYGEMTQGQTQTVSQPFTYVGQYGVMAEPYGYYYMRARYYDSGSGRFVSEDPLGFGGGDVNLYAYVWNNPITGVDPLGLWTISIGVIGNAGLGFGLGGGLSFNFGCSAKDGWSFSISGTAQGGPVGGGAGASVGGIFTVTNADNVNQLNGTSYEAGRAGLKLGAFAEGVKGDGYIGISTGIQVGSGYTATYGSVSTTSALVQYNNGVLSVGNSGKSSIMSFGGKR